MAGVVLDARAEPQLTHHLEVEGGALPEPLGLEDHALLLELAHALLHLRLDVVDGRDHLLLRRDVVGGGVDVQLLALGEDLTGQRVQLGHPLDLIPEELDARDEVVVGRLQLEGVATDAELGPREGLVVARVLQVHQLAQHTVSSIAPTDSQPQDGGPVVHRRTEAVDAGHAGHDDHVPALEQRPCGGVAQLVDLVVAAGVLLDVRVAARQVRLRLVVVEVADEVLDRVVREEVAELAVELRRERLVVGQHQGGPVDLLDDPRDGGRLARACGAQQDLVLGPLADPLDQPLDGLRLVAGGLEGCDELEVRHAPDDTRIALETEQSFEPGRGQQTTTAEALRWCGPRRSTGV